MRIGHPPLLAPPLYGMRPPMCSTTPSTEFQEDFVDGLPLGNGSVDNFVVNVIIDHDALGGAAFFVGPGYVERRPPSQHAEDSSGDFQCVSTHTLPPTSDLIQLGLVVKTERF